MSLTAIVPVWNGRELLARLLDSLENQTQPPSELLVVDNGSTDGAPELARGQGARIIAMGRNAGFAAAVNRGIRESRTEWVAVLNSDVELSPDYLAILCAAGAPFATGKILMAATPQRPPKVEKPLDGTFDLVCRGGVAWRAGNGRPDSAAFSVRRSIWSAPWTAAVFRRDLFDTVGLLDERFESYYEDVEFGIRCALHGVSGLYVPDAVAWHRGSSALGPWHPRLVRLIARNQCYLVALHYPLRWAWPILVAHALWGLVALRHRAGLAWLRGKLEGLRYAPRLRSLAPDPRLLATVLDHERLLYSLQEETGWDSFWRVYYRFAGRRQLQ
jgi:GT2 family glycosyltransferase